MNSRRVLLVDDDDDIREVAQLSIEATTGWEVVAVSDGAKALVAVAEGEFDVILLDVMMPGLDGPATFRKLQEIPGVSDVPVLLLTAKVQRADLDRYEDLGVAGTLRKPFDPVTIGDQISDALGWR